MIEQWTRRSEKMHNQIHFNRLDLLLQQFNLVGFIEWYILYHLFLLIIIFMKFNSNFKKAKRDVNENDTQ